MWDLIVKIWYFIFIFPIFIITEGYDMLKKFFSKHNMKPEWAYILLLVCVVMLLLLIFFGYGV